MISGPIVSGHGSLIRDWHGADRLRNCRLPRQASPGLIKPLDLFRRTWTGISLQKIIAGVQRLHVPCLFLDCAGLAV